MGIHWARDGTVAVRTHNLTRHKVYAGPAVQIALDVSEAAHGGQIVLTEVRACVRALACTCVREGSTPACHRTPTTNKRARRQNAVALQHQHARCSHRHTQNAMQQDAVIKLSDNMALAGFPVIRLEGLFQLPSVPCPVFLFSATEVVGKPLRRTYEGLRKIRRVWPQPKAFADDKVRCCWAGCACALCALSVCVAAGCACSMQAPATAHHCIQSLHNHGPAAAAC